MDVKHTGGCHCGEVRFEVLAPARLNVIDCNCSICVKKQNRHFIVPESKLRLVKGASSLNTYTFDTHKAKHMFCKRCGVQSFYIPRSNQGGYGVMPHCLDPGTVQSISVETFDGNDWEESIKNSSIPSRSHENGSKMSRRLSDDDINPKRQRLNSPFSTYSAPIGRETFSFQIQVDEKKPLIEQKGILRIPGITTNEEVDAETLRLQAFFSDSNSNSMNNSTNENNRGQISTSLYAKMNESTRNNDSQMSPSSDKVQSLMSVHSSIAKINARLNDNSFPSLIKNNNNEPSSLMMGQMGPRMGMGGQNSPRMMGGPNSPNMMGPGLNGMMGNRMVRPNSPMGLGMPRSNSPGTMMRPNGPGPMGPNMARPMMFGPRGMPGAGPRIGPGGPGGQRMARPVSGGGAPGIMGAAPRNFRPPMRGPPPMGGPRMPGMGMGGPRMMNN